MATRNLPPGRVAGTDEKPVEHLCDPCIKLINEIGSYIKSKCGRQLGSPTASGDSNLYLRRDFAHHSNRSSLGEACRQKCHICSLLWNSLADFGGVEEHRGPTVVVDISLTAEPKSIAAAATSPGLNIQAFFKSIIRPHSDASDVSTFVVLQAGMVEFKGVISQTPGVRERRVNRPLTASVSDYTGSKESLKVARDWIQSCKRGHHECQKIQPSGADIPFRPTRLVDVSSGSQYVRVHRTADAASRVAWTKSIPMFGSEEKSPDYDSDYVALSHAWGGADFTKLTSQSYTRLCDEFSLQELPQTWRDAIQLTRSLGYRFIWIDALCIIQDSLYDWEVEAACMGQVYANCDLNIAALSGTTSYDGLFQYRDIDANFPCDITDAIGGDNWPESLRLHSAMIRRDDSNLTQETGPGSLDYVTEMANGSLNKRGWVLQERTFSPRTLYFGKSSLFWDCRSLELDEFPSIAATDVEVASRKNVNLKKGLPFNDQINSSKEIEKVFETWYKLLKIYCASGLTFETDRLLAISGIAKLVARKTKSDYYVGIWEHRKLQDLIWCVSERASVHGEREDELPDHAEDVDNLGTERLLERQVSFSWASIGGPADIHWPYYTLSQVEGVEVLFRAQIQGFILPPRPTAFTSVNWNDDLRFERAVAGSFSISCPVHKFQTAEVSDWDEARRKVGQEILAAGPSLSGMPFGVRYFPDRKEAYGTTMCRASLAHVRLPDGSIADFGLILSPAKTDLQGRILYKRLGMYYELYGKGETYSKFRRGFYRNGSVIVI